MDMHEQEMNYQDLNFKMNFPTRRAGTFAVWGTGLIDQFVTRQKDKADWEYNSDRTYSASTQYMGAADSKPPLPALFSMNMLTWIRIITWKCPSFI